MTAPFGGTAAELAAQSDWSEAETSGSLRAYPPNLNPISGLHREGRIANKQLQQRFDTNITNIMDLVRGIHALPRA